MILVKLSIFILIIMITTRLGFLKVNLFMIEKLDRDNLKIELRNESGLSSNFTIMNELYHYSDIYYKNILKIDITSVGEAKEKRNSHTMYTLTEYLAIRLSKALKNYISFKLSIYSTSRN